MPPINPDTVRGITNAAFDLLNEAQDLTSGRDPNYIRDGQPENVIDRIALEAARQGCRRYAADPGSPTAARKARVERACRPYLDDIGKPPGPQIKIPFEGGQCEITYFVNGVVTSYETDGSVQFNQPFQLSVLGPVGGLSFGSSCIANPVGPLAPSAQGFCAFVSGGNGVQLAGGNGNGGVSAVITSVVPAGPQPDNCGNPPPDYIDPAPDPNPEPPGPRPFNPAPDIDIEIEVEFNPDFSINIDIGTGPITIDPFGDGDGDGGGGDPGDPGDPTDPGDPGAPEDTGEGGEASGCAPAGQELVGLFVTVASAPGDANKFANNPKQPYRGIGYIRMGYPGRLGLDISGGTVISPQFFHAQQRGLSCWEVAANTGFELTVVPFYREVES